VSSCSSCPTAPKDCKKCEALRWSYNNETYGVCPSTLIESWHIQYLDAYRHYKNGLFGRLGGLENQHEKYLEAMSTIESELNKIESEKMESMKNGRR